MNSREKLAEWLSKNGWVPYNYPLAREALCLEGPRLGNMDCELNDKPPSLHIQLNKASNIGGPDTATFNVFGEIGGLNLNADISTLDVKDVIPMLGRIRTIAQAVWETFAVVAVDGVRSQPPHP